MELNAQAASHREAAVAAEQRALAGDEATALIARQDQAHCESVAAEFEQQLAEQQESLDTLRLRLTQVDATLQKLRSQRDLLQARMRAAQARLAIESGGVRRRRPWFVPAAVAALCLAIGLGAVVLRGFYALRSVPLGMLSMNAPVSAPISQIVLWNEHNGPDGNSGAQQVTLSLLRGGETIWKKEKFEVPFGRTGRAKVRVPVPRWPPIRSESKFWPGIAPRAGWQKSRFSTRRETTWRRLVRSR